MRFIFDAEGSAFGSFYGDGEQLRDSVPDIVIVELLKQLNKIPLGFVQLRFDACPDYIFQSLNLLINFRLL